MCSLAGYAVQQLTDIALDRLACGREEFVTDPTEVSRAILEETGIAVPWYDVAWWFKAGEVPMGRWN